MRSNIEYSCHTITNSKHGRRLSLQLMTNWSLTCNYSNACLGSTSRKWSSTRNPAIPWQLSNSKVIDCCHIGASLLLLDSKEGWYGIHFSDHNHTTPSPPLHLRGSRLVDINIMDDLLATVFFNLISELCLSVAWLYHGVTPSSYRCTDYDFVVSVQLVD